MLIYPAIYYSAPNPGGGPQGAPAPNPTPAPPQPAPGQGQGQGDGFRQQYFANVPDDVWGQVEPHIRGVQGHVTQMEQRYAPLRGYSPEAVQGLASLAAAFDRDPLGAWIDLAQRLQAQRHLPEDIDLEHLGKLVRGEDIEDEEPVVPDGGLDPNNPLTKEVLQLRQLVQQLQGGFQQFTSQQRERTEDVALRRQLEWMKNELKGGGIDENLITDEALLSSYIAHRGNVQAAVKQALDYRTGLLKGVVNEPERRQQQQELDLPNGAPPTGKKPGSNRRGMFGGVEAAAEQAVRNANRQ